LGLASLYLGGAIVGLACVGYALCREAAIQPGLGGFVQNCLGVLFNLTLARGGVVLLEIFAIPGDIDLHNPGTLSAGAGVFFILPALAWLARRAGRFSSRVQPTRLLVAIIVLGFITEILVRIAQR
jgi:hypothetical protein